MWKFGWLPGASRPPPLPSAAIPAITGIHGLAFSSGSLPLNVVMFDAADVEYYDPEPRFVTQEVLDRLEDVGAPPSMIEEGRAIMNEGAEPAPEPPVPVGA